MSEYSKMKNDELSALLKDRKLPHTGKKAEMVERLQKDDEKAGAKPAGGAEDEIDWDDDDAAAAPAPAPAPAAAAPTDSVIPNEEIVEKAGGEGQPPNPQAVPNQVANIDPAQTDDLTLDAPAEGAEEGSTEAKPEEKKEPTPDYSRGLAATNLDEEIEKRKKRALKFGTKFEDDEGLKKLERAKKFGEAGPPKGLDEALPERRQKRGREGGDDAASNKRREAGRAGGRGGRRDNRNRDSGRDTRRAENKTGGGGGAGGSWMSEKDRAAAEARKAKFAKPAA
ncbi:sap domain-containing protein [Stemphylium lycopersici]|uniref:Sap domain-containing protein n=1 Tax=Stemphylium lycopersici TaxID=183478 RepID=A0A364MW26_STELY|nr:sap domain-containing protein [Stemphylium lycopersici]